MRSIRLKPGQDRRLRRGHLWAYSNEIDSDLTEYEPGEAITLLDEKDRPVGSGTVNPHNLIAVRLHDRNAGVELDKATLERKIGTAWRRRERLGYGKVARAVHGEADGLPGLIVDRFGDVLSVQHNSIGMEVRRELILEVLDRLFEPKAAIAADDSHARALEGLELSRAVAGEPGEEILWYELDGLQWPIDIAEGQKTGGYLDQAANHRRIAQLARGAKLLDAFSYHGGFAMSAAKAGAERVVVADSSARALNIAREAFARNELPPPTIVETDLLGEPLPAREFGGQSDIVIVDPPPLVRKKAKKAAGMKRYEVLFASGFAWTKPEGLCALFSCSHQMSRPDLLETIKRAERRAKTRTLQLELMEAGPDHPVAPSHPETEYLHGALMQVG